MAAADPLAPPFVDRFVTRTVAVGGADKAELRTRLLHAGVRLNEAGAALFADARFETTPRPEPIEIVEISVADLHVVPDATSARIHAAALELGLGLCALEVGPWLRLQWLDQPEGFLGHPASRHRAPPGSLTVASRALDDDYEVPKGFYLRCIESVAWLRGYRCDADHVWSAGDRFVFRRSPRAG